MSAPGAVAPASNSGEEFIANIQPAIVARLGAHPNAQVFCSKSKSNLGGMGHVVLDDAGQLCQICRPKWNQNRLGKIEVETRNFSELQEDREDLRKLL